MSQEDNMCHVDATAADIINTTSSLMAYNNDRQSYSHTFIVDKAGPISIFIYANDSAYINAIYYSNLNFAGFGTTEKWTMFNLQGGLNNQLAGGTTINFSYEFDTSLLGPITDVVNFYIETDDGLEIMIDGMIQPFLLDGTTTVNDNLGANVYFTASFSYTMIQDQLYRFQIRWNNAGGGNDRMLWYWDYENQAQTIIPSTSYYYPSYTGPTVINSLCPTGYSSDVNNNCVEV